MKRTVLKTLSYATMHMSLAILVAFVLSGSWKVALVIGMVEPCVQTVAFFFHERFWHKVDSAPAPGQDHHDSIIDSVSPLTQVVEKVLRHRH